jgi:chitinase
MPGWKYDQDTTPDPSTFLKTGVELFAKRQKLDCSGAICLKCEDNESSDGCCGCVNMMIAHHFDNMDACEDCNGEDGQWPGFATPDRKRNIAGRSSGDAEQDAAADPSLGSVEGDENDYDYDQDSYKDDLHSLEKRVRGTATMSDKKVSICGGKYQAPGSPYKYPAFPAAASYPWENIDNDDWETISRY